MKTQWMIAALLVTGASVAAAQPPEKGQHMGFKPTPERVVKYLDEDGDGLVSLVEFQMPERGARRDRWEELDTDGDGGVSRDEVQGHIDEQWQRFESVDANDDDVVTPDEVKAAIFAKLDANGDGYLSADEFTEAREQRRDRRQGN